MEQPKPSSLTPKVAKISPHTTSSFLSKIYSILEVTTLFSVQWLNMSNLLLDAWDRAYYRLERRRQRFSY